MSPRTPLTKVRRKMRKTKAMSREGIVIVERRKHPRFNIELPLDYRIEREDRYGGITAYASIDGNR